jgi:chromosome segregation ATPase
MSKQTKSEQIEALTAEKAELNSTIYGLESRVKSLDFKLEAAEKTIQELYTEIDQLIHTPKFAADTEAAFDRGRQDGVRSLVYSAQDKLVDMQQEIEVLVQSLVRKYSRDMSWDLFQGNYPTSEDVKLPETDFTHNLLANAEKL